MKKNFTVAVLGAGIRAYTEDVQRFSAPDDTCKMLFTAEPGRRINFFGTKGEIVYDQLLDTIEVKPYFGEKKVININASSGGWGHGGGDAGLVSSMYDILTGKIKEYTTLEESVESHLIGICAEKSRLSGGENITVHE